MVRLTTPEGLPHKKGGGTRRTLGGKKRGFGVFRVFRVIGLKRSTAGAFAVPFRVLSGKKKDDRRYLIINCTNKRYSKQSSLMLLKIMQVSVNALF